MIALLFAAILATQQLTLSADVGKKTFFEDEPIYFVMRLQSHGTDTARTFFFGFGSTPLNLFLRRENGELVGGGRPAIGYRLGPEWRGVPLPPGTSVLRSMVLQVIMGDASDLRHHLYAFHLPPGRYSLRLEFDAHGGVPGTTRLTLKSNTVAFRVRARTREEQQELSELEAMREMEWDTTHISALPPAVPNQYFLIQWVARRWRLQPDDPFLPFLIGTQIYLFNTGQVPRFDVDTSALVSRLRLAIVNRKKRTTAGACLVQGLSTRHPDQVAVLAKSLGPTLGGDMARSEVLGYNQRR